MELNTPSQKVLLNNKFKKEGVLKKQLIYKNKRYDEYYYGLSLKDFKKIISFKNLY
jgi:RimJ/RimL family protein N-acetyltransferase|tara:strand:+ start:324 stop:491 length:168 start_codon:yes stop_codon:yes gene_type:complete